MSWAVQLKQKEFSFMVPAQTAEDWLALCCTHREDIFRVFQDSPSPIVQSAVPVDDESWHRMDHMRCGPILSKSRQFSQDELTIKLYANSAYWNPNDFSNSVMSLQVTTHALDLEVIGGTRETHRTFDRFDWYGPVIDQMVAERLMEVLASIGRRTPATE